MKDSLFLIFFSLLVISIIGVPTYFIEKYKYQDCKKVGHTKTYCVLDIFR